MSRSRRYKVVRIIARLNIGGPAIQAITLTSRLNPAVYESVLVTGVEAAHEGNMLGLAAKEGVEPVVIASLGREISLFGDFFTLMKLIRLLRRERPDIVHTHTAKAGFLGRIAASLVRAPVIVHTFHGHVLRGYFSPLKTSLFLALERFCARRSDRIIAISPSQRSDLLGMKIGTPKKMTVVPLGFDLDPFVGTPAPPDLKRELGIKEEAVVIGIAARLTAIKNISRFLRAAAIVNRKALDVHFVVVGDGEERAVLERQADDLGLAGNISFLGWRADMPALYQIMDIVALSSDNEGTPVTLIEAMAAARAVAATDVGGVSDFVRHGQTGLVVPVSERDETDQALAAALTKLILDPNLRRSMGDAARGYVLTHYSFDRLRADIEGLYLELLQEKAILN